MAEEIVAKLLWAGLTVSAKEGKLSIGPRRLITPDLDEAIKANRDGLLAWLIAPWGRQAEADQLLKDIDVILEMIQLPEGTPIRFVTAAANLKNDCRELAQAATAQRDWRSLKQWVHHAGYLQDKIPAYCRDELIWMKHYGKKEPA